MGFFSKIEDAKVSSASNYMRPGQYELEIRECKLTESPRDNTELFIIEYKVLSAAPGSAHAPGDEVCHCIPRKGKFYLGDVKAFASAATGIKVDKIDEKGCEAIVAPGQPLRGKKVRARAWDKPTKSGGVFTKIAYEAAK